MTQESAVPMENPFHQRQKLIRSRVTNTTGEESQRYVELENFRLWEYLMSTKHGHAVNDLFLCLWVSEDEFQMDDNFFTRAGESAEVNHIVVELFDEEYGFTNTIKRFVTKEDTDQVVDILTAHIPKHLFNSRTCQIDVFNGFAIEQWKHTTRRPLILGIEA